MIMVCLFGDFVGVILYVNYCCGVDVKFVDGGVV